MPYTLISCSEFTPEQRLYIESVKETLGLKFKQGFTPSNLRRFSSIDSLLKENNVSSATYCPRKEPNKPLRSIKSLNDIDKIYSSEPLKKLCPNYYLEFGCSRTRKSDHSSKIDDIPFTLEESSDEYKVAFLMVLCYSNKQIVEEINLINKKDADFTHEKKPLFTKEDFFKCRGRIAKKFNCEVYDLRNKLTKYFKQKKLLRPITSFTAKIL